MNDLSSISCLLINFKLIVVVVAAGGARRLVFLAMSVILTNFSAYFLALNSCICVGFKGYVWAPVSWFGN